MAQTGTLSNTLEDTVTLSRELREEGQIDGQVKLYNVDDDDEFESDAELFFERTLMTQGLREALSILRDSLTGDDPRGTHILYGPYGSGKSHQMVALYHCFDDPAAAGAWASDSVEGFDTALPESATPVTVAMQNEQYEYLWEPFFEALRVRSWNVRLGWVSRYADDSGGRRRRHSRIFRGRVGGLSTSQSILG